eukprot:UN34170
MSLAICSATYALISCDRGWLIFAIIMQLAMASGCYVHWGSNWQNTFSLLVMLCNGAVVTIAWRLSETIEDAQFDLDSGTYKKTLHQNPMGSTFDLPDMEMSHYKLGIFISSLIMFTFAGFFFYFGEEQKKDAGWYTFYYAVIWNDYIVSGTCLFVRYYRSRWSISWFTYYVIIISFYIFGCGYDDYTFGRISSVG